MRYSRIAKLSSVLAVQTEKCAHFALARALAPDHYSTLSYYCIIHFICHFSVFVFRLNALCSEPNAFVQFSLSLCRSLPTLSFSFPLTVLSLMSRVRTRDVIVMNGKGQVNAQSFIGRRDAICVLGARSHVWLLLQHIVRLCHFHIPPSTSPMIYGVSPNDNSPPSSTHSLLALKCI